MSFAINEAPSSGTLTVSPGRGFALDTSFTLTALNWVDEDLPLSFRFGTLPVSPADGSLDAAMATPFGGARSSATYAGATLSAGSNRTNFTAGCFVTAVDSYGAEGFGAATLQVLPKPLSLGALRNMSEAKATAALQSGDADAAKQILSATLAAMDSASSTATARRRRLLGDSDDDSSALLASVLANLWATYAITAVTQADMASLLSSLAAVVDSPDLCTDSVTAGSVNFLNTVLGASYQGQVGISSSAAANVASAFSFILETTLFNTSDPKSLSEAGNITAVLNLASANQLLGAYDGVGYSLSGPKVDMFSYRSEALGLLAGSAAVAVSSGTGGSTAARFNTSVGAFAAATGAPVASGDLLDVRVATLGTNLYEYALLATAGTAAAAASRADQPAGGGGGASGGDGLLLRSKLTVVEVASLGSSSSALAVSGLGAGAVLVGLEATHTFDTDAASYERAVLG